MLKPLMRVIFLKWCSKQNEILDHFEFIALSLVYEIQTNWNLFAPNMPHNVCIQKKQKTIS